jgi:hypothetical protein
VDTLSNSAETGVGQASAAEIHADSAAYAQARRNVERYMGRGSTLEEALDLLAEQGAGWQSHWPVPDDLREVEHRPEPKPKVEQEADAGEKLETGGLDLKAFYEVGEEDRAISALNKRFFILTNGRVVRDRDAYGHPCPLEFLAKAEFINGMAYSRIERVTQTEKGEKRDKTPTAAFWYHHSKARRFRTITCDPSSVAGDVYNTWQGFAVKAAPGDWPLMKAHILDVLAQGNEEWAEYITKWAAWMVQNPAMPAEVALVFRGKKGGGKGSAARPLHRALGAHARHVSSPGQFLGRFNGHLRDTVFLFCDEAFWAGEAKKVEGDLKRMITEPTLSVEAKYKDIVEAKNMLHIMIASNENWVIPATPDERRFAVFDVNNRWAQSVATDAERKAYFAPLHAEMEGAGLAAMLWDLLHMDLKGWHPREDIPMTPALRAQIARSEPGVRAALREVLEDGVGPVWGQPGIPANVIATAAVAEMVDARGSWVEQEIGQELAALGGKKRRLTVGGYGRTYCYEMPPLAECRRLFDGRAEWPEEPAEWFPTGAAPKLALVS